MVRSNRGRDTGRDTALPAEGVFYSLGRFNDQTLGYQGHGRTTVRVRVSQTHILTLNRCRARKEKFKRFPRRLPENGSNQGQNLALTVLCVPNSLGKASIWP